MLEIINNLEPFFEDCYRWISVREYARTIGVSPPTASKMLAGFKQSGLLVNRAEFNRLLFKVNSENRDLVDLSRIYWRSRLEGLVSELNKSHVGASIILFGSCAKAEVTSKSDIDIAVFAQVSKDVDLDRFEKKLGRAVSLHWSKSLKHVSSEGLRNNMINGYVLQGRLIL